MTSYTLSPFLLTHIQTAVLLWIFIFLSFCMVFIFFFSSLDPDQVITHIKVKTLNPAHVRISSDFCRLLITYANSWDPDQDRQQVRIACALILMGKKINFLMTTIKRYYWQLCNGNCTSEHLLGKIKGTELTFENLAYIHTVVSLRP